MLRRLAALVVVCVATGCGNPPTRAADPQTPDAPAGEKVVRLPKAGVRFRAPLNWPEIPAEGSRAGGIQNKRATVAIWRYERAEPLPVTRAELREVRRLLIERVEKRDPTFELERSSFPRRGGAPTIELVGRQTIGGLPYGVRSAHVYFAGAEIVVDAFAPPEHFDRLDRSVFVPLLESLELSRP